MATYAEIVERVRQAEAAAPAVLPDRLAKPLLSVLAFLAKEGQDTGHHWLAGRLAAGVLALPADGQVSAVRAATLVALVDEAHANAIDPERIQADGGAEYERHWHATAGWLRTKLPAGRRQAWLAGDEQT